MSTHDGGAAHTRGRRTQTSKGRNRGRCGEVARQTLCDPGGPHDSDDELAIGVQRMALRNAINPHAQVIGLDMTPPGLRSRIDWVQARYRDCGRCVVCDELEFEQKTGRRVVAENDLFIALVPFAATCPFELRLIPRLQQTAWTRVGL
jgi:hypothetical protein